MATRRGTRSDRGTSLQRIKAELHAYTGDDRGGNVLYRGGCGELALLAGTPDGPQWVRETLTAMSRRQPHRAGLLSTVPDVAPTIEFK